MFQNTFTFYHSNKVTIAIFTLCTGLLWILINCSDSVVWFSDSSSLKHIRTIRSIKYSTKHKFNVTQQRSRNSGCQIPNFQKTLKFMDKGTNTTARLCPKRYIFIDRTAKNKIKFRIHPTNNHFVDRFLFYRCSYHFVDSQLRHSSNTYAFINGTAADLDEEIILVECPMHPKYLYVQNAYYTDAYLMIKAKNIASNAKVIESSTKSKKREREWNILIVGVDTMSRARAYHTIPNAAKFLKSRGWLEYLGYNKVGLNTFANVMAFLTGKNSSSAYTSCANRMDACRDSFIWSKFKDKGYFTAFGEDNVNLPDTFLPYHGFSTPPTDHYAHPFFQINEYRHEDILCSGNKPSSELLLEYAAEFAQTYKNDSFFGFFWINSYSHSLDKTPHLLEYKLIEFFETLRTSKVLNRTFVFFISDHGIRFGKMRTTIEFYYEDRLPMFFMYVPHKFRKIYPTQYRNLKSNQYRLTSPYDFHMTLWNLLNMSKIDTKIIAPEACPNCKSFTEEIGLDRSCGDAQIDEKWCTCHDVAEAKDGSDAQRSLELALSEVLTISRTVKTQQNTKCSEFKLKEVLRKHRYRKNRKTYYIIAFSVSPGDITYEAIVENFGEEYKVLHPIEAINSYNENGWCVLVSWHAAYCSCVFKSNITSNKKY